MPKHNEEPDFSQLTVAKKVIGEAIRWWEENHVDRSLDGKQPFDKRMRAHGPAQGAEDDGPGKRKSKRPKIMGKRKCAPLKVFTVERTYRFLVLLKTGSFFEPAAYAVGTTHKTVYQWLQRGSDDTLDYRQNPFRAFFLCVMAVSASVELQHVNNIRKLSADDGKLSAWFLQRRYSKRWQDRKALDVTSNGEKLPAQSFSATTFVVVDAATATPVVDASAAPAAAPEGVVAVDEAAEISDLGDEPGELE